MRISLLLLLLDQKVTELSFLHRLLHRNVGVAALDGWTKTIVIIINIFSIQLPL